MGVPFEKGWYGVTYRTQLGLHRGLDEVTVGPGGPGPEGEANPGWDMFVGPLPFLIAPSDERPYLRESVPPRRERFDSARDAGENSLDSGLWIRSWTSWHLGAGQTYAEPLEAGPEVARFRFNRSAGLDPWTPGQISPLDATTQRRTDVRSLTSHPSHGVIAATAAGVRVITGKTDAQVAPTVGSKITVGNSQWLLIGDDGKVYYGALPTGTPAEVPVITGATSVQFAKDRLWVGAGGALYEVTDPTSSTQTPYHTFVDGKIVDIDSGAGGVYVMVDQGLTRIYVITAQSDGTLNAPREVATLPRGERGTMLYGYLSRYLVVGTTKGVRIADCSTDTVLPLGPLTIEMEGGCLDATASGNFVWVTGGDEGVDRLGDGSGTVPCLYRIDISAQTDAGSAYGDSAAARYAYATDLQGAGAGRARSVTIHDDLVYFGTGTGPTGQTLWMQDTSTPVSFAWLTTGAVSFSTAEAKAWQSVVLDVGGDGHVMVAADTGSGFSRVAQTEVATPFTGSLDFDRLVSPPSDSMEIRLTLTTGVGGRQVVRSLGIRCTPAAKRTRQVRLPLMCFDHEMDRHNAPVGYDGFAYDRIRDIEALEEQGALILLKDVRTGETLTAQIEGVGFRGVSAPDRGRDNFGGYLTLTLLVV